MGKREGHFVGRTHRAAHRTKPHRTAPFPEACVGHVTYSSPLQSLVMTSSHFLVKATGKEKPKKFGKRPNTNFTIGRSE